MDPKAEFGLRGLSCKVASCPYPLLKQIEAFATLQLVHSKLCSNWYVKPQSLSCFKPGVSNIQHTDQIWSTEMLYLTRSGHCKLWTLGPSGHDDQQQEGKQGLTKPQSPSGHFACHHCHSPNSSGTTAACPMLEPDPKLELELSLLCAPCQSYCHSTRRVSSSSSSSSMGHIVRSRRWSCHVHPVGARAAITIICTGLELELLQLPKPHHDLNWVQVSRSPAVWIQPKPGGESENPMLNHFCAPLILGHPA